MNRMKGSSMLASNTLKVKTSCEHMAKRRTSRLCILQPAIRFYVQFLCVIS